MPGTREIRRVPEGKRMVVKDVTRQIYIRLGLMAQKMESKIAAGERENGVINFCFLDE